MFSVEEISNMLHLLFFSLALSLYQLFRRAVAPTIFIQEQTAAARHEAVPLAMTVEHGDLVGVGRREDELDHDQSEVIPSRKY